MRCELDLMHEYAGVADRVDSVGQRGSDQAVEQAIEQARRGADAGKLSRQFGLSPGEAELIARMHGAKAFG